MRQILLAIGILGGVMPASFAQTTPPSSPVTAVSATSATAPAPETSYAPVASSTAAAASPRFSDDVVVTASVDVEGRDVTPATVTVIDGQEIEARQAHTLADLLWSVPGLTVAQAGAPGQQTSVFTRGANSNQTLLLWNGIPLNDPYFGDINWQFVPTDGAQRVEVVRGPFSALYGSNAVGGVVQLLTGSHQGLMADVEGGDRSYVRGGVAVGANPGPVQLDLIGHVRNSDDTRAGFNDYFDSQDVMGRALWTIQPGITAGALVRVNDSNTGVPFSSGTPTPQTSIAWQEREVAIPFTATGGPWLVDAQLAGTRFNDSFRSPDDPFGAYASQTQSESVRGRAVGSYQVVQQPGQDLTVALGTEGEGFHVTNVDSFGTNLDHAHQRTWAGFGQVSYGGGPVHLEAGVRRDDNDAYGGQTSLRAGGVLRLAEHTLLRASYGQAFRAPSLGELYFPFSGNPDLRPETSTSYEVSLEQRVDAWHFLLTGFENRERNLISFDNFLEQDVNIGRARSRGLEGEIGYRHDIWYATLNGTRLEAKDLTTGLDLARRPKESANLLLMVRPGDWTVSFTGRYIGPRADLDPVSGAAITDPGYVRLDLAGSWRALAWLAPYARIENIADRTYEEVAGYPAPGRTFVGGVAVNF
jgi:vitamin B12 transporter